MEHVVNETQGISSFDSYDPGFSGLFVVANGFNPWKRVVADFPESVCHLYNFLFTIGY